MKVLAGFAPVLMAEDDPKFDEVSARYGLQGFPTVVFTKPDGTEVGRVLGAVDPEEFRAEAERALGAAR